jgi:hypothetical protein
MIVDEIRQPHYGRRKEQIGEVLLIVDTQAIGLGATMLVNSDMERASIISGQCNHCILIRLHAVYTSKIYKEG